MNHQHEPPCLGIDWRFPNKKQQQNWKNFKDLKDQGMFPNIPLKQSQSEYFERNRTVQISFWAVLGLSVISGAPKNLEQKSLI